MANGFPEGKFRIVNEATGASLFTRDGGVEAGPSYVTRSGSSVDYSSTRAPKVMLGSPASKDYDLWWFDAGKDSWGSPYNYLTSTYENIKGKFALIGVFNDPCVLWGTGRSGVTKWQAEDGYFFEQGRPDLVLTQTGTNRVELADRGAANQTWRFESETT